MTNPDAHSSNTAQALVHFDVGGKIYRILRGTIERYPKSLLATLLSEFPDSGGQDKPLLIDRSCTSFDWIVEIYRSVGTTST